MKRSRWYYWTTTYRTSHRTNKEKKKKKDTHSNNSLSITYRHSTQITQHHMESAGEGTFRVCSSMNSCVRATACSRMKPHFLKHCCSRSYEIPHVDHAAACSNDIGALLLWNSVYYNPVAVCC